MLLDVEEVGHAYFFRLSIRCMIGAGTVGIGKNNYDDRFTMDNWLRPDAPQMVIGVEGKRAENVRVDAIARWPGH